MTRFPPPEFWLDRKLKQNKVDESKINDDDDEEDMMIYLYGKMCVCVCVC